MANKDLCKEPKYFFIQCVAAKIIGATIPDPSSSFSLCGCFCWYKKVFFLRENSWYSKVLFLLNAFVKSPFVKYHFPNFCESFFLVDGEASSSFHMTSSKSSSHCCLTLQKGGIEKSVGIRFFLGQPNHLHTLLSCAGDK